MKKSLLNLAGALLLAFAVSNVARADSIEGTILIGASGSYATIDFGLNTVTFHPSTNNAQVSFGTGDYAIFNSGGPYAVSYNDFQYDPLLVSGLLWTSAFGSSFNLTSITSISEVPGTPGSLDLFGTGTATLAGFAPTSGIWSFSADTSGGGIFSFSSTATAVPDGGTTALLLGFGLVSLSLAAIRRKTA